VLGWLQTQHGQWQAISLYRKWAVHDGRLTNAFLNLVEIKGSCPKTK
jgi:hypothetical protein